MRHVHEMLDSVNATAHRGPVAFFAVRVCGHLQPGRVRLLHDSPDPCFRQIRPRIVKADVAVGRRDLDDVDAARDVRTQLRLDLVDRTNFDGGILALGARSCCSLLFLNV